MAYSCSIKEKTGIVEEAEGWRLHCSRLFSSGYAGVTAQGQRFAARIRCGSAYQNIGLFDTAVEAAVAYARAMAAHEAAREEQRRAKQERRKEEERQRREEEKRERQQREELNARYQYEQEQRKAQASSSDARH